MKDAARILIINDDAHLRRATVRLLSQAGYGTWEASTGEEGWRLAKASLPDLILLGVMLPDTSGLELCCCIKADEVLGSTCVALLSGYKTAAEDQAEGLEAGADGYIVRPISSQEFLARVRAISRTRQTALALWDSEGKLRALFDVLPVGISVLDAGQNLLDASGQKLPSGRRSIQSLCH